MLYGLGIIGLFETKDEAYAAYATHEYCRATTAVEYPVSCILYLAKEFENK